MKNRYRLIRRAYGIYYSYDKETGHKESLQTDQHIPAERLIAAKNQAFEQPALNKGMAKVLLSAASPEFASRTWNAVMEHYVKSGVASTRDRKERVFRSRPFAVLRTLKLVDNRIFVSLRRIKRFFHVFRFHVRIFENGDVLEINPVDLFALEAIRLFKPTCYTAIASRCGPASSGERIIEQQILAGLRDESFFLGAQILEDLEKAIGKDEWPLVEPIIKELFPQLDKENKSFDEGQWIRDVRVCHGLFFKSYFSLLIPEEQLTQRDIDGLLQATGTPDTLKNKIQEACAKTSLSEVIRRLHWRLDQILREHVASLLAVIWDADEAEARSRVDRENLLSKA